MKNNTQWSIRITQTSKLVAYCALLIVCCASSGCGPKVEEGEEFSMAPVPRLAKYYPQVDASGDTTYDKPEAGTFIDQNGKSFSTSEFAGSIQVVQVFFASCKGICPVITNSMGMVQREFSGNPGVKLISFTVDPDRDSVPAMQEYAQRFEVDSARWKLLTGEKKTIYDMIRYEYLLPNVEPGTGDQEDFIHSDQLVLIDKDNIIRGYYGGTDTAQVRMLTEDIHTLLNEK